MKIRSDAIINSSEERSAVLYTLPIDFSSFPDNGQIGLVQKDPVAFLAAQHVSFISQEAYVTKSGLRLLARQRGCA